MTQKLKVGDLAILHSHPDHSSHYNDLIVKVVELSYGKIVWTPTKFGKELSSHCTARITSLGFIKPWVNDDYRSARAGLPPSLQSAFETWRKKNGYTTKEQSDKSGRVSETKKEARGRATQ